MVLWCSDILTPLAAMGVPFEIDDHKGPIIERPISRLDQVLHCCLQVVFKMVLLTHVLWTIDLS